MTDTYKYWRDALDGNFGPVHDGDPQSGFYRKKLGQNRGFAPVAIWQRGGKIICLVNGKEQSADELWTWVCQHPITKEAYDAFMASGQWPDDAPKIGDNRPPEGFDDLRERIEENASEAIAWLKDRTIENQQDADRAANWRDVLNTLGKLAESERKREKEPHLNAGREVDSKYRPLTERVKEVATKLRGALTVFLNAEEKRRRAKAAAEAKKAEEAAERAAAKGESEPELPVAEPVKVAAGGARGKRASLRSVTKAEITDYAQALEYFAEHSEVQALIEKLCNATIRAGGKVPGVRAETIKVAA